MSEKAIERVSTSRRALLQGGAALALSAASYRRVLGANDRVGLGFIGFGLIGKRHVLDFKAMPDVDPVAVAEVHRGRLEEAAATMGGSPRTFGDFRRLLDDRDVDAVVVSTPDHWHALMTMMACAAGKDVYVEKPLSLFVREGRWMAEVARRHGRVVQVGTQQRSGPHYQKARELIRSGQIGPVVSARMWSYRNVMPGFGSPADGDPPPGFDHDQWLGPAPKRPYNPNRALYHFRWHWDYSGGQMTNLGQHSIDIVHWFLDATAPKAVACTGGRFALKDNGETPDTQDALFEYDGWTASWSHREASRGAPPPTGLEFCGTRGSLMISRKGFTITPDPEVVPEAVLPRFGGAHPVGGPPGNGDRASTKLRTEAIEDRTGDEYDQFRRHARDFVDAIRSRRDPISDLESEHRVVTACHLANISLRLGRKIRWDQERESIIGDPEAEAMLERPYRSPWDAERRALIGG
ncbi:Gfo/Idh/MocA family protein [Tundrisphaera lichenicola]|uniref:Gfo/Idh/MocA family protein n=1 Tax=Tundrisphaera lichenicola TaxID=2029860 RepID=UPI003EBEE14F